MKRSHPKSTTNGEDRKPAAKQKNVASSPDAAAADTTTDKKQEDNLLTPHMMRLLRLIREGTVEHAQQAAAQLTKLTSHSCPLVLWDTLGRLQAFLTASEWKTRQNATIALQGVAAHLPVSDQIHFLQADYRNDNEDLLMYLTVQDLLQGMQTIMEQGRLLLAASDTKYDAQEEQELVKLDQTISTQDDFVQQRIRLQRRILAQRLGLEGIQKIVGDNNDQLLPESITSEDILPLQKPSSKRQKHTKQTQKRNESRDNQPKHSVRALLVMEMEQQRNKSSTAGAVSHQSPQTLLATELIYRMFDASWTVRHGALLGTLSLLRAWKAQAPHVPFGSWPHDILARCLCVLALDRFGDFSESNAGSSVVAPVRETAGQLLSVLLVMAPPEIQKDAMTILVRLAEFPSEWEVRHGALVALKFVVVVVQTDILEQGTTRERKGKGSVISMVEIGRIAIDHLTDDSDDVKSVAAQILVELVSFSSTVELPSMVWEAPKPLWASLRSAESLSSCIPDLFALFVSFLRRDSTKLLRILLDTSCEEATPSQILQSLVPFLDSDFESVRTCALRSIGVVTGPVCEAVLMGWPNETKMETAKTYCCIVERLYGMYFDEGNDEFSELRGDTWMQVAGVAKTVFLDADEERKRLQSNLVCMYFGVKVRRKSGSVLFHCHCLAANALATFLLNAGKIDDFYPVIQFALGSFTSSPWFVQCEAACILYQALSRHSPTLAALGPFHTSLVELLQSTPLSLSVDLERSEGDSNALVAVCDAAFLQALEMLDDRKSDAESACKMVAEVWVKSVNSSESKPLASAQKIVDERSMRLRALIAGAIVSGGLPSKITPIVRALMTSLKNESCGSRQLHNCESITSLLGAMGNNQAYTAARNKILNSICDMIASCSDNNEENSLDRSPAARVIQSITEALPSDKSLKTLPPVWSRIEVLSSRDAISADESVLSGSLNLICAICGGLMKNSVMTLFLVDTFVPTLVRTACQHAQPEVRCISTSAVKRFCLVDSRHGLRQALGTMMEYLKERRNDSHRQSACHLLKALVEEVGMEICPFIRHLLPLVMSLMTDPIIECSSIANNVFACLVRLAPLVNFDTSVAFETSSTQSDSVIDHLILGKPLPTYTLPTNIEKALEHGGIVLRNYQKEGVAWLHFLQTVKLNGALCDSMGLGKTLQALLGVALSHHEEKGIGGQSKAVSLVVCPSTLVGHWLTEIDKAFPGGSIFRPLSLLGSSSVRKALWRTDLPHRNMVVTSYAVLRSDIDLLASVDWRFCILDEGHLLKNPKTATAKASRRLRATHRLILTGTPVQNRVNELWATFDFLMPNFLGSSVFFSKEFARPIAKSQVPGASAAMICEGIEKLKVLHQQVLPFVLRREKDQVLKELPPKNITIIKVPLSQLQSRMYDTLSKGHEAHESLRALKRAVDDADKTDGNNLVSPGSSVFKYLLFLRLLCTHPALVRTQSGTDDHDDAMYNLDASSKVLALAELLRDAGIYDDEITAADNDLSLLYCDEESEEQDSYASVLQSTDCGGSALSSTNKPRSKTGSKCLVFAQFGRSLDIVEKFLLKPHMPSLRYLRLDGSVAAEDRTGVAERFNRDPSIKLMLLTTRVGGLGLNLTGADTVIFLEHDFNPFADLQAMDRAHRIGQHKTVNVYRLVVEDSIEEKIMELQEKKIAMSDSIVNTDNSTMYSMGTDKLLDIFTLRSGQETSNDSEGENSSFDLDALVERYSDDYASLQVDEFVQSFQQTRK